MKIIRVSGCHDCPCKHQEYTEWRCNLANIGIDIFVLQDKGMTNLPYPSLCPLEDEVSCTAKTVSDVDSFSFLNDEGEDIYTLNDGEPI